jgi:hypothetical protein
MTMQPNSRQWRVIWTACGVIFVSGLFLLDLQDLYYPALAEQEVAYHRRVAAEERDCSAARARHKPRGYRDRLPDECFQPPGNFPSARRENAQRRVVTHMMVSVGLAGALLVWQLAGRDSNRMKK